MTNSFDPTSGLIDEQDAALLARRTAVLGAPYRLFYERPVALVRGSGAHLFDADGRDYLDAYNNVPVLGHSHPGVAAAVADRLATLNTHTRYLTDGIVDYSERLVALFPPELSQVVYGCTGSEAVDLALRIARHVTGARGTIITSHAYHGTTQAAAELSPSLGTNNPIPSYVERVVPPDPLRDDPAKAAASFAAAVAHAADRLEARGERVAALIVDSVLISDGLIVEPVGLLAGAAAEVRRRGGLYLADEVQPGFGRTGEWWGFSRHGVVPDLTVLGKPMGNGLPISAVVGRAELFDAFGRDVRYFNTFGGNAACIAAADVVLHEIEAQGLLAHARRVGASLTQEITELAVDDPRLGDVRGLGLCVAIETVDPETREPDSALATRVVNGLRDRRILVSASGPRENVVKVRPPLVFDDADVDRFVTGLSEVLHDSRRSTARGGVS